MGVLSIPEFYEEFTGNGAWSEMEDEKLAMAVNGRCLMTHWENFRQFGNNCKMECHLLFGNEDLQMPLR